MSTVSVPRSMSLIPRISGDIQRMPLTWFSQMMERGMTTIPYTFQNS
jgi:hypothetical protein